MVQSEVIAADMLAFTGSEYLITYVPKSRMGKIIQDVRGEMHEKTLKIGFKQLVTNNSFRNINETNCNFQYTGINGVKLIVIPPSAFGIADINEYIKNQMLVNLEPPISVDEFEIVEYTGNTGTQMTTGIFSVDFTYPNSINILLGFDPLVYAPNNIPYISQNIAKITTFNTIYINFDGVSGASNNFSSNREVGTTSSIIYSAPVNVPSGYRISVTEISPVFYVVAKPGEELRQIRVYLTNYLGQLANNGGELVELVLYFILE